MNAVLEEILNSGQVIGPGGPVPLHSNVTRDEGVFLQDIVVGLQPRLVVEVGLAYGISALFLCEALAKIPGSRLIAIDPFQSRDWDGIGMENLKKAGYAPMVQVIEKPSQAVLPQLVQDGLKIDLAFIDGWHTFDHALVDFFYVDQLLRVGGTVVLDDTGWPSLRKLCRFILANRAYQMDRYLPQTERRVRNQILRLTGGIWRGVRRLQDPRRASRSFSVSEWEPRSRCIAFRKAAEDTRRWDFYRDF